MTAAALRGIRDLRTPEGVSLPVLLGERINRVFALTLDLMLMGLGLLVVVVLAVWGLAETGEVWVLALAVLAWFAIRNLYFLFFELRWRGRTPGKRAVGLQVVDAGGGPLRPRAVVARNLMREVELFLPLSLLLSPSVVFHPSETLVELAWLAGFTLFPLFNRDRQRVGDLIAGTWVIRHDLRRLGRALEVQAPDRVFTDAQLAVYGPRQLKVLEEVLRLEGPRSLPLRRAVAQRIARKIDAEAPADDRAVTTFLHAYYTQFRARLERRRVMGQG